MHPRQPTLDEIARPDLNERDASIQQLHPQHQLPSSSHLGFQIHNRYLVTQDEHGMVLVDQHALHERILYEQLRKKTESRTLESQQLLVPEPLDLTPAEAAAALDSRVSYFRRSESKSNRLVATPF